MKLQRHCRNRSGGIKTRRLLEIDVLSCPNTRFTVCRKTVADNKYTYKNESLVKSVVILRTTSSGRAKDHISYISIK